jgi:hypothetical protein
MRNSVEGGHAKITYGTVLCTPATVRAYISSCCAKVDRVVFSNKKKRATASERALTHGGCWSRLMAERFAVCAPHANTNLLVRRLSVLKHMLFLYNALAAIGYSGHRSRHEHALLFQNFRKKKTYLINHRNLDSRLCLTTRARYLTITLRNVACSGTQPPSNYALLFGIKELEGVPIAPVDFVGVTSCTACTGTLRHDTTRHAHCSSQTTEHTP